MQIYGKYGWDSPASNGGRGLKQMSARVMGQAEVGFARQQWRAWIETFIALPPPITPNGFARQQWRAWIETPTSAASAKPLKDSPASNGGRGLKQAGW